MADSIFEDMRSLHSEIEAYQTAAVNLLKNPESNPKNSVIQGHAVNHCIEHVIECAERLTKLYEDADGAKKAEINAIEGTGSRVFSIFYGRLREIKEYHNRFPGVTSAVGPTVSELHPEVIFSGEEKYGTNVDMHTLHNEFQNLGKNIFPGCQDVDYITYLDIFARFDRDKQRETNQKYQTYVKNLYDYITGFVKRALPLVELDVKIGDYIAEYETVFSKQKSQDPLYCEACQKTFAKDTVFQAHLNGKKHKQAVAKQSEQESPELAQIIRDTKDSIMKKFGRTAAEIDQELEEGDEDLDLIEDEPEKPKRRIDHYPTGWDGKPIPYWLYKLHGLGVEYKCEICGDYSYWGRRAFEKHFQEARHQNGMAALRIPNTRHFQDITKIKDAQLLWENIQRERQRTEWRPEVEEEFEDANGTVYTKKLYDDLVIAAMTEGKDVSSLFTDVVKCMQTTNLELKKLVYLYVMNYAKSQPDRAILAVNTFQKDATDPNPLIRALAVRTMGCIRVENITEYLSQPLVLALKDSDPYVRKTAAVCVAKLYDINPDMVEQQGFIDLLQDLYGDSNPVVVANAIAALTEINETSTKPVFHVDSKNISKLLAALSECTEWGQVFILDSLTKFRPADSKEAESVCERVVPRLNHNNSAVVLSAAKVILIMLEYITTQDIIHLYCKKLSPPLITLLSSGKEYEIQYVALRNINIIIQRRPEVLQNELKVFFCKYNDPIYVKLEKLEIMIMLTNENNIDQVLPEFKDYAQMVDIEFVRKSVRAIGRCAIKLERAASRCVQVLLELINTKVNYVVQEATIVIRDIFRKYPNQYESIISNLCENLSTLDEPEAKAAMVWIIGEYSDRIENAAELLESFLENFKDETVAVQLQLLTAIVKLFLKKSKEGHDLIQKVLQLATKETDNPDLRDRGFVYWRLLSTNPEAAKSVVLAERPPITDTTSSLSSTLCKSLIPYIGSLASVYHKLPEAFISKFARTARKPRRPVADENEDGDAETDANALNTNAPEQASETVNKKSNLLLDLDDILGISSGPSTSAAPSASTTSASNPLDDLLGLSSSTSSAPQKQLTLVLPADKGDGMELEMGLSRDSTGKYIVDIHATNKGSVPLTYIAVQFNKNSFGITPQTQPRLTAPLQPGSSVDVSMEVNTTGQKTTPVNYTLQVAVKNSTEKIFYFFMPVPQNLF